MFDGGGNDGVANDGRRAAPYASWSAVCAVLKRLHSADGSLPDVIRRRDLDGVFAPTVVKQILAAFRFMGLIDSYHRPTQRMRDLVAAYDKPNWPSALADVVGRSFPELSGLDLGRITREDLDAAFQAYRGSSDEVRKKCVRFFLSAARDAGIPLSVELSTPYRHSTDAGHSRGVGGHLQRENEARELFPNPQTAPTHLQAQEPDEAVPGSIPQRSAEYYRTGFAALVPYWDPGELPDDVEAAVVTVLRYFRRKEAETTKA